jgi:predicted RNase H-like nuclease (RuvC/YqgF family)
LTRTTDGRITKKPIATTTTTATTLSASLSPAGEEDPDDPDIVLRRQRNNLAAKRYRQKKIDRIDELEKEVEQVKQERDELKIRLARQEAEVAALREMLQMQKGSGRGAGSKD